ncbi:MAG: glycosyltransferase, partial [bacterium]
MRVFVNALSTANSFGIGRYTRAMIQGLALAKPKDAQLYVYTRDPDSVMLPDPKKVIFVRPGAPGANRLLLEQGDLPRAISRARADVFISPDFTLPQICPAKKRIVTVHDMLVYTHPEGISAKARLLYRTFLPGSIRRATSILADSEYTRRSMADLFPLDAHKAKVVYPALSLEFLGAECSPPGAPLLITPPEWTDIVAVEEPFLLSVGSSSARKNTDRLAAVFCEWRQKTDWPGHLVLVGGDGAFHRPKSRIWDVGFQDDRTLRTFYYRAAGLI